MGERRAARKARRAARARNRYAPAAPSAATMGRDEVLHCLSRLTELIRLLDGGRATEQRYQRDTIRACR